MQPLQIPPIAEGEIYIGCIGDVASSVNHVILLPGDNDPAPWKDQIEWAQSIGGDLPTIIEMAMLYTHFVREFREKVYWTRDTVRCPGEYAPLRARYHSFADGHQNNFPLETSFRARAVRRVPAQTHAITWQELARLSKIIDDIKKQANPPALTGTDQ